MTVGEYWYVVIEGGRNVGWVEGQEPVGWRISEKSLPMGSHQGMGLLSPILGKELSQQNDPKGGTRSKPSYIPLNLFDRAIVGEISFILYSNFV